MKMMKSLMKEEKGEPLAKLGDHISPEGYEVRLFPEGVIEVYAQGTYMSQSLSG